MRYEVLISGVPKDLQSMIVEAPDHHSAILRAGILVGKAARRRAGVHINPSEVSAISALPTDKFPNPKNVHVPRNT